MKILFLAIMVLVLMPALPGGRLAADTARPGMQTAALYGPGHSAVDADEHFAANAASSISANTRMSSGLRRPVQFNQLMFLLLFLLFLVAAVEFGARVQAARRQPSDTTDGKNA